MMTSQITNVNASSKDKRSVASRKILIAAVSAIAVVVTIILVLLVLYLNGASSVNTLETRLGQLEDKVMRLEDTNAALEQDMVRLTANKQQLEDMQMKLARQTNASAPIVQSTQFARVSFMARDVANYAPLHTATLVFPVVDLNQGGGYNASTGVFTAPAAGVYIFLATLQTMQGDGPSGRDFFLTVQGHGRQSVRLIKDDALQLGVLTRAVVDNDFDSASLQAVLRLSIGSRVWLKAWNSGNRFALATDKAYNFDHFNAFSGVLISQDP